MVFMAMMAMTILSRMMSDFEVGRSRAHFASRIEIVGPGEQERQAMDEIVQEAGGRKPKDEWSGASSQAEWRNPRAGSNEDMRRWENNKKGEKRKWPVDGQIKPSTFGRNDDVFAAIAELHNCLDGNKIVDLVGDELTRVHKVAHVAAPKKRLLIENGVTSLADNGAVPVANIGKGRHVLVLGKLVFIAIEKQDIVARLFGVEEALGHGHVGVLVRSILVLVRHNGKETLHRVVLDNLVDPLVDAIAAGLDKCAAVAGADHGACHAGEIAGLESAEPRVDDSLAICATTSSHARQHNATDALGVVGSKCQGNTAAKGKATQVNGGGDTQRVKQVGEIVRACCQGDLIQRQLGLALTTRLVVVDGAAGAGKVLCVQIKRLEVLGSAANGKKRRGFLKRGNGSRVGQVDRALAAGCKVVGDLHLGDGRLDLVEAAVRAGGAEGACSRRRREGR
eukprot:m.78361 g.78361  ORF g.78361 m.78361 type:complete len:451 (+) comp8159_c0_seq3:2637-3989(+)